MTGRRQNPRRSAAPSQQPARPMAEQDFCAEADVQALNAAFKEPVKTTDPGDALIPEMRDRLMLRLRAMDVAADEYAGLLAKLSRRSPQSVRRWIAVRNPGLPDLVSFTRLCVGLGCNAGDLLGLTSSMRAAPADERMRIADSIQAMAAALAKRGAVGRPMCVRGDEMAPLLCDGDLVFVGDGAESPTGNGIYALEHEGRPMIRRLEQRLGDLMVLKCDNPSYGDWELRGKAAAQRSGLRFLGKVQGSICMRLF
jgi:hypothetical protein